VSNEVGDDRDEPSILHCFADYGVESEILSWYGDVVRVGIDARDTNESEPIPTRNSRCGSVTPTSSRWKSGRNGSDGSN
jgi:hypothetical protein